MVNMGSGWYRLKTSTAAGDGRCRQRHQRRRQHPPLGRQRQRRSVLRSARTTASNSRSSTRPAAIVDVAGVSSADSANIQQWPAVWRQPAFPFRQSRQRQRPRDSKHPPPSACHCGGRQDPQRRYGGQPSGKQYKALVSHTVYAGTAWNPVAAPTLWQATTRPVATELTWRAGTTPLLALRR